MLCKRLKGTFSSRNLSKKTLITHPQNEYELYYTVYKKSVENAMPQ